MFVRLIKILLSTFIFHIQPLSYLRFIHYKENGRTDKSIWLSFVHISFINIILNAKKCLSSWIGICTVSTGIEPAISCVTGRRVNRYTTRPLVKRRKRDSNPREPLSPCRFSRPIPSAGLGYSSKIIWTLQDSNLRPNGYEPLALTNWAKGPKYNFTTNK